MSAKNYPNSFPIAEKLNPTPNYEVPSNRVTKLASQMLQKNRREVEMNLIRSSNIGSEDLSQYPQKNPVGDRRNSD